MKEKFKTLLWFGVRPKFWAHAFSLASRFFKSNNDSPDIRASATAWAAGQVRPMAEIFVGLGLVERPDVQLPRINKRLLADGAERVRRSGINIDGSLGGAGDLELLYALVILSRATKVLETGVAYGWSSLVILAAQDLTLKSNSMLVSIDMPYVKARAEGLVGVVVPKQYRDSWILVRQPDRPGILKGLELIGGSLDLVHYDSDKSWHGRSYAYPILWNSLRPGGLFVSDDIQDNFFFRDFVEMLGLPFFVSESDGKFVGIIRKPS